MIAVIADDFTGAAEIGGIGLKYGLEVRIETEVIDASDVDLLIIATDTRSLTANDAAQEVAKITQKLIQLKPQYIYKKLDSVLRGNIAEELLAQMSACGRKRAIVVAGNPFLGRIIENGNYTIDSIPLNKTQFVNDPDFPVKSSSVIEIIGRNTYDVISKSVTQDLPQSGLIIGNVTNSTELKQWSEYIDNTTVAAGGSGFFDILLSREFSIQLNASVEPVLTGEKTLLVSGSAFPKTREVLDWMENCGIATKNMPEEVYSQQDFAPEYFENWVEDVLHALNNNQKVIISVDHENTSGENRALRVKKLVAQLVKEVMLNVELDDLFIEGGATTSQILGELNIEKLYPVKELDFGIIQMRVDEYPNLCITTKPGSYSWPKNISFKNTDKIELNNG
ncbi:four-carbon acid sugar kinase family protein [uncultured Draconibacterium sp.]|uniref:four-carbon acid sugar kinase family protein n=1 Tax=uncultured Draconibacterium sp. TaxID=1573823 RepID=UPI00321780A6